MKSTRETLEQIKKFAKYHEALLMLANDHSDINALEHTALEAHARQKDALEELTKVSAQVGEAKAKLESVEKARAVALKAADDIRAQAKQDAIQIAKDAKAEAESMKANAQASIEKEKALLLKSQKETEAACQAILDKMESNLKKLDETISAKQTDLASLEKDVTKKTNDLNDLQDKIGAAKKQISRILE